MKEIIPEEGEIINYSEVGEGRRRQSALFTVAVVLLVGLLGFGLGRLSKIEGSRVPVTIEYPEAGMNPAGASVSPTENRTVQTAGVGDGVATLGGGMSEPAGDLPYVASRNGTRYYFTWCGGASRISDKNKVYFASAAEAEARGLSKASNCPGL